jgi:hypothetical protein
MPEEVEALRANRARSDAGSEGGAQVRCDDQRLSHKAKTVTPGESMEERRARFKQRCSEAALARWKDPVKRARMLKSIRMRFGRTR